MEAAVHLATAFHAESWYRDCHLSIPKVQGLVEAALMNRDRFAIICADPITNEAVGYMLAIVSEQYFGHDLVVNDLGLYILPEYRNPFAARDMIRAMEVWGEIKGAREYVLGVSSGINDKAIARFYERLGYTKGFFGLHKKSR